MVEYCCYCFERIGTEHRANVGWLCERCSALNPIMCETCGERPAAIVEFGYYRCGACRAEMPLMLVRCPECQMFYPEDGSPRDGWVNIFQHSFEEHPDSVIAKMVAFVREEVEIDG